MRPLADFCPESRAGIRGVLFDIDDTLTTEGRLTASAYAAVEALKNAGFIVVPITGRPAGWCDHIARMWPIDGVVGENGAFYFFSTPPKVNSSKDLSRQKPNANLIARNCAVSGRGFCAKLREPQWPLISGIEKLISLSTFAKTCQHCRVSKFSASSPSWRRRA